MLAVHMKFMFIVGWNHLSCSLSDGPKMKGLLKRPRGKAIFPLIFNFRNHVHAQHFLNTLLQLSEANHIPSSYLWFSSHCLRQFILPIHQRSIASTSAGYTLDFYLVSEKNIRLGIRLDRSWTDRMQCTWKESTRDWILGQKITSSFGI